MTDQAVARRIPWATLTGWVALVLAAAGATGAVLAALSYAEGVRDPQSFGTLGAVGYLIIALFPSVPALVVALVQARRRWAPPWRTSCTTVLAALAPGTMALLLVVVAVRNLVG